MDDLNSKKLKLMLNKTKKKESLWIFPYGWLVFISAFLPSISIALSLFIAIIYHFEKSVETHCNNWNILPTVSAAVNNPFEKYLFRYLIGLYSTPKIILDIIEFVHLKEIRKIRVGSVTTWFKFLNLINFIMALLEDSMLYLLAMVSSGENHPVHEFGFIMFMVFAHIHFVTYMLTYSSAKSYFTENDYKYWKLRIFWALTHTTSIIIAGYLYWRHNAYCEDGILSIFAFFEYVVIAMNILFHSTPLFEYGNRLYFKLVLNINENKSE